MGIQGLLPLLKSIHKPTHLRNFAGQTLGIDAYGWLHRGTVSCAIELAQQKPTRKHIEFALSRVRMLIHFGVKPYLVFDGDYLPSKAHTEKERAAKRKESKKMGLELLAMGRIPQAHLELQKAVDVTPYMARELIEELKQLHVPYVVAPYEADSQLAYLEKHGIISGVLSEDSDLLVFGVKCLITKLDQYGECVMINRAHFTACREVSLVGWTDREFRMMAMLSGCDYLSGIDKMGLKTAYRLVRKHKVLERLIRAVQLEGKMKVPAGYLEAFDKAEKTFLYQWVFCPKAKRVVNLNSVPAELDLSSMPFIGKDVEHEIATGVAAGDLHPNTKERITISKTWTPHPASWSRSTPTTIEKTGKPISEWFKPKRTPLAELDPNSFTPSPSQQRLMHNQRGTSWSASQVQPTQPPVLQRMNTTSVTSSAPQASRRAISDQWPDTRRVSPKRQRLCSDTALTASMDGDVGLETATSRFFSKSSVQPSPSIRKASEQRRKKKDEFELWSDDSALEAAAALTAEPQHTAVKDTPSRKKRKKIRVYEDTQTALHECEPGEAAQAILDADESQEPSQTLTEGDSQGQIATETPATSFESTQPEKQSPFSKGVDVRIAALKSRFAFQATSPRKSPHRMKSAPAGSVAPLQEAERNQLLGRLAKCGQTSEEAAGRDEKTFSPEAQPTDDQIAAIAASPRATSPKKYDEPLDDEIDDEEWLAMEGRDASSPAKPTVRGSEDLLIPNSPDSSEGDGRNRPKLDLGQFVYAGYG